jgi:hypothetical protein
MRARNARLDVRLATVVLPGLERGAGWAASRGWAGMRGLGRGARGPTREELARWAEREGKRGCWAERGGGEGERGEGGGWAGRDGPGRRGGLNSIFPFLSLFYLF